VARLYADLALTLLIDEADRDLAPAVAALGVRPVVAPIIMGSVEDRATLARRVLAEIATQGFAQLVETMAAEAKRAKPDPAARLVAQGVGYMAFAAAHPMMFRLMFYRETERFQTPALAEAARAARAMHFAAVEAALPLAPRETKVRMSDFAWATVHGFISLLLERQIGEGENAKALRARGVAILADMAETVMRAGGVPD